MNRRFVFRLLGKMLMVTSLLMVLPLIVSLVYKEDCYISFLISMGVSLAIGFTLMVFCKTEDRVIYAKEGFVIVALSWLCMSAVGALPFVLSGEIPSYIDAFFETVSGFTTTGASILDDVEMLSHGTLFWRSFTHWVGGMGVLVFIMAIIPASTDRSIHILRAEVPGPIVGKLVPKMRDTAIILYLIYIVLTVIEIVMLLLGGMPLFDSLVHSFGTAGTGGFGIKSDSIASYSPYLQWVITVFMMIFGVNFNLYYLLLTKKIKSVFRSEELWTYIGIGLVSTAVIAFNIRDMYSSLSETVRISSFQVATIVTTTGYATADFNLWPDLSKTILLLLMFIGSCAGSTAGGFKISRVIMLFKMIKREIKSLIHPRAVGVVRFEGKKVDDPVLKSLSAYFAIYVACFIGIFLLISFDGYDILTNFSASAACFNNIGPGLGAVGPAANYAGYSVFSKFVLSVAMLLGRLEIYPILFFMSRAAWSKK
ncbi:MAG: TrkH family potassium uptake protein [Clostridia bacterium]|nr:TrkH family potassium uptake protein [Clostridia bacterium]